MEQRSKKVFVALSGGVDSAVAAALLKRAGYDVTGVFIKVWQPDFLECTWRQERRDAMRVAAHLEIPFLTYDFAEEYKRDVVDYMIREYKAGRTPNPDVACNTYIKFDALLQQALTDGANGIATGHYVIQQEVGAVQQLFTARDSEKDQSYFLWGLTQQVLNHTQFPIGAYTKKEIRALAEQFDLPTAQKKDSQGLCFLGKLDMKEFLSHYIAPQPGAVLNEAGNEIGEHEGAFFYTLGQRHGFRITAPGEHDPHFVTAKDLSKNTITVGVAVSRVPDDKRIHANSVNWITGESPAEGSSISIRTRYRGPLAEAVVEEASMTSITIRNEQESPLAPPGQSLVIYKPTSKENQFQMLGGGIIS